MAGQKNRIRCVLLLLAFISGEAAAQFLGYHTDPHNTRKEDSGYGQYISDRRDRYSVKTTSCDTEGKDWKDPKTLIVGAVRREVLDLNREVISPEHCKALCINIKSYDPNNPRCEAWNWKLLPMWPASPLWSQEVLSSPSFRLDNRGKCFLYSSVSGVTVTDFPPSLLFDGPMDRLMWTTAWVSFPGNRYKSIIGRRYMCDEDKKAMINQTAAAYWEKLIDCKNNGRSPLTCSYKKITGILDTNSESNTDSETSASGGSTTTSFELESSVTGSAGVPELGEVETTLTYRMGLSAGFNWSQERAVSKTVAHSRTRSHSVQQSVTTPVQPGEHLAICQPVGKIGTFEIRPATFCASPNGNCNSCSNRHLRIP